MRIDDFRLERYFSGTEFNTPFLLGCSDCQPLTIGELLSTEQLRSEFLGLGLGYGETLGSPALRREISKLYRAVSEDDVIAVNGAEEGIFLFMNALLAAGDHVVVQVPAYQSLYEVARAVGCRVDRWTLLEGQGWAPDVSHLADLVRDQTRLLVVNFPHNPTGAQATRSDVESLVRIARARGAWLFSDEVYRFSEHAPEARLPGVCDLYEKGVSLGVMSKSFGLAGLRVGWLACRDRALLEKVSALRDYTTICNSTPGEFLATVALRQKDAILQRNMALLHRNLELLRGFFDRWQAVISWTPPRAGPVGLARVTDPSGAEQFCRRLRQEAGVLLVPGTVFDCGDQHVRIGFGRSDLPVALERLDGFLVAQGAPCTR